MIFGVECSCVPDTRAEDGTVTEGTRYADGTKPSFYTLDQKNQAEYWYRKFKGRKLFWGVHLDGLHLVGKP